MKKWERGVVGGLLAFVLLTSGMAWAQTTDRRAAKALPDKMSIDLGGGLKMDFVLIQSGSFTMGSEKGDDEKPPHKVTLTKPFYMGVYEVTQAQWKAVMGDNPSYFKGDDLPVERVSWEDCQKFVVKLKEKLGEGFTCRLPTEAEWEYACRAGSNTAYCFGDEEAGLGQYAWYGENSDKRTHPVGQKKPNAWGLYDMHGNVWEWCQDWFDSAYYGTSTDQDPKGPSSGSARVLRGGSWLLDAVGARSALRCRIDPALRYDGDDGCRMVVAVQE